MFVCVHVALSPIKELFTDVEIHVLQAVGKVPKILHGIHSTEP